MGVSMIYFQTVRDEQGKARRMKRSTDMKKSYDKKAIMSRAHEIRRENGLTMGEALKAAWAEVKKGEPEKTALDATAQSLFKVRAMLAKLEAEEAALEDAIKAAIAESGADNIAGFGWKASFRDVESRRFDSKTFKAEHADIYAAYSKKQVCKRFLFAAV